MCTSFAAIISVKSPHQSIYSAITVLQSILHLQRPVEALGTSPPWLNGHLLIKAQNTGFIGWRWYHTHAGDVQWMTAGSGVVHDEFIP